MDMLKKVVSILKLLHFEEDVTDSQWVLKSGKSIPLGKILLWAFTCPLFVIELFYTIVTPFQMPYDLPTVIQFVFMCALYTIFLYHLIKKGTFDFGWFAYTLLGSFYLWWHHPQDIIQPPLMMTKRWYSFIDFWLTIHTVLYNIIGFWCLFSNFIKFIKNGKQTKL